MKRRMTSVVALIVPLVVLALVYNLCSGFRGGCAYVLALFESKRLESHSPRTRQDVERNLFLVSVYEYSKLTNLFAINFFTWNEKAQGYEGNFRGRFLYVPKAGDQYVSYRVLDRMPFDFIYDGQGRITYWSPSFDY